MRASSFASSFIARLRTRRTSAAAQRAQQNGNTMSIDLNIQTIADKPAAAAVERLPLSLHSSRCSCLSSLTMVGLTTTQALACACGCSVFDVGGLDLPQEQDHGGRVFFEFWGSDQTQNYVGSSRAPAALNSRQASSIRNGTMSASATTSTETGASWYGFPRPTAP